MTTRSYRLGARVFATLVLAVGVGLSASMARADGPHQPDLNLNPCHDITVANRTPVLSRPDALSGVIKYKDPNQAIAGSCFYYSQRNSEGSGDMWYMQVALGSGGYGFIWVQELARGEQHKCDNEGHILTITSNSDFCRLEPASEL